MDSKSWTSSKKKTVRRSALKSIIQISPAPGARPKNINITPTISCMDFIVNSFISLDPMNDPKKAATIPARPNPEKRVSSETTRATMQITRYSQISSRKSVSNRGLFENTDYVQ